MHRVESQWGVWHAALPVPDVKPAAHPRQVPRDEIAVTEAVLKQNVAIVRL